MGLKTKISIIVLAILFFSCNSKSKKDSVVRAIKKQETGKKNNDTSSTKTGLNCSDFKFDEYYYNDKNTFKNGSIKMFSFTDNPHAESLNKLILKNSLYILTRDNYSNKKELESFISNMRFSKYFSTNSEYFQNLTAEELNEIDESIATEVFCIEKIIVYKTTLDLRRDKGSPYFEYINIDLNEMKLVDFNSLISSDMQENFNKTILLYATNHKKEIVNNYEGKIAQRADQLLSNYQDVFEEPKYDYNKLKFKIDSNDFSHFNSIGLVFNISIADGNFPSNSEQDEIERYTSEITIPYKKIKRFLNKKNSLYSSINNQK